MSYLPLLLLLVAAFTLCGATSSCDGTVYDDETQACCGVVIHDKDPLFMCCDKQWLSKELYNCRFGSFAILKEEDCGGKEYNELKEVCCGGDLHPRDKKMMCCRNKWVPKGDYDCMSDRLSPRPLPKLIEC